MKIRLTPLLLLAVFLGPCLPGVSTAFASKERPVIGLSLDTLTFPKELMRPELEGVAMAITYYRPPGEPWGRYVLLLVSVGKPGMKLTAESSTP